MQDYIKDPRPSKAPSLVPRWAQTVVERRAMWLNKKHPKMNCQKLQLWATGASSNGLTR